MDRNNSVLEISSDEDVEWNDHGRGISDDGDDYNWFAGLLDEVSKESKRDDSDAVVVVVGESEKPVKKSNLKSSVVDLDDDCVVLDCDPNAPVEVRSDGCGNGGDDSDDVLVVSEKGQVACRDYPHSRHLCIKFPFSTTPNQSHCNQCYCYVCDSLAPCAYWGTGTASTDHCRATDKDEFWKLERKNAKNGCKIDQTVSQLPPGPVRALLQPQYPIPRSGPVRAHHTPVNLQTPDINDIYRKTLLATRTKVHPDLASQFLRRAQQKAYLGSRFHEPRFKRTVPPVRRGNCGNLSRQQNYHVNGMQHRSSRSSTVNPQPLIHQPQVISPTYTSSTVNPQPLIPQPQVPSHSNLIFHPRVNPNPFLEPPYYQQPQPVPPFVPQSAAPIQPSYVAAVQPSYPVPSQTRVVSSPPIVPVPDPTLSQGNQAPGPVLDSGFKDYELGLPAGHDSATHESLVAPPADSTMATVSGGLGNYQYDWIFDDQPIEPGFTDYSSDSAYIDTGPIFDF